MNFFNQKIVTKTISLEDAVKKAQEPKKLRSLDEVLADISNGTVKTASSSQAEVKTAAAEAPKAEAKPEEKVVEAAAKPQVKIALDMGSPTPSPRVPPAASVPTAKAPAAPSATKPMAPKAPAAPGMRPATPKPPMAKLPASPTSAPKPPAPAVAPTKPQMSAPKPAAPKPAAPAIARPSAPAMASSNKALKIASSLDFRNWEAEKIVAEWKGHGSVEACVKNVGDKASDGQMYCSLLRVAANEADKVVKAAAAKAEVKTAAPVYKKIAKLTSEEQSFLREFFTKIYGNDYVSALLDDY